MGQKRNDVAIIRYFKNEKNYIFWKRHACQSVLVGEGSRSSVDSGNGHTFQCSRNLAVTVVDIEQTDLKAKTVDEVKLVNTIGPTCSSYLIASYFLDLCAVPFSVRKLGSAHVACKQHFTMMCPVKGKYLKHLS